MEVAVNHHANTELIMILKNLANNQITQITFLIKKHASFMMIGIGVELLRDVVPLQL